MRSIQARILAAWPEMGVKTANSLLTALRKELMTARHEGRLRTGSEGISQWVRIAEKIGEDHQILGGERSERGPASARLVRDDGAWIHFKIRARQEGANDLTLIGYDFEIVFPEPVQPRFVRVDLNPEGHPNAAREVRSHIHPGSDDLQWPAPVMTPQEILSWMLGEGLRPRDPNKPRK